MVLFNGVEGEWVAANASGDADWYTTYWRHIAYCTNGAYIPPPTETGWEKFVPAAVVPTEAGAYTDREGDLWVLTEKDGWQAFDADKSFGLAVTANPQSYLPFTNVFKFTDEEIV